jgi:hypothetical protein
MSVIKFYYFELRLYLFPPGICCLFDESSSHLIPTSYGECKKVILGDQAILTYDGVSKFKWLKFYFSQVFPLVRKGGLVFIKVAKTSQFIYAQNLNGRFVSNAFVVEILSSNNLSVLAGSGNLYITMIPD